MRKLHIISCFLIICTLLIVGISYAVAAEQQARICAEENLPKYLAMIEPNYNEFHFSNQEDVSKSKLGDPIPNVRIGMSEFDIQKNLNEQLEPYAFYVFPVMVDGKPITDLTVMLNNGKWEPVDIGGRLSTVIDEVNKKEGLSSADSRILRFAGQTFVLVTKEGKQFGYAPFFDQPDIGLKAKELVPYDDFCKSLGEIAKEKIQVEKKFENDDQLISMGNAEAASLDFKQENVISRLANYLEYQISFRGSKGI